MKKRNLISGIIMLSSSIPIFVPLQAYAYAWGGDIQFDDSNHKTAHFLSDTYQNYYSKNNYTNIV